MTRDRYGSPPYDLFSTLHLPTYTISLVAGPSSSLIHDDKIDFGPESNFPLEHAGPCVDGCLALGWASGDPGLGPRTRTGKSCGYIRDKQMGNNTKKKVRSLPPLGKEAKSKGKKKHEVRYRQMGLRL